MDLFPLDTSQMKLCEGVHFKLASHDIVINSISLGTIDLNSRLLVDLVTAKNESIRAIVPEQLVEFLLSTVTDDVDSVVTHALPLLVELALQDLLETIEAQSDVEFAVRSVTRDRHAIFRTIKLPRPRAVNVHVPGQDLSCPVILFMPPSVEAIFDEWVGRQAPLDLPFVDHLSDLPVLAEINVSSTVVPPSFISNIEVGDVLKLPKADVEPEMVGRLRLGDRLLGTGRIHNNATLVIDALITVEAQAHMLDRATSRTQALDELIDPTISRMPSGTLDVDVGFVQMSARALKNLSVGDVLELPPHHANQVNLKVDGKVIAKGEFIKIGGAQGVMINTVSMG